MRIAFNSQFFLDPEAWESLANEIVPELLEGARDLKCWSAGCYTGKEPFSLAVLLSESHPDRGKYILATDSDMAALQAAAAGGPFSSKDIECVPGDWRTRYLTSNSPPYFVTAQVRAMVEFRPHDLLRDPYPSGFDMILYRNLEPCFSPWENHRVWAGLRASLRPRGMVFTGATDQLPGGPGAAGFERLRPLIYRRSD